MMITGNEDYFPSELRDNHDKKKELKFLFQIVSNKE